MAHLRAHSQSLSEGTTKGPHAVSLKVLRLSRPSLSVQHPLPRSARPDGLHISPSAGLAVPSSSSSPTTTTTTTSTQAHDDAEVPAFTLTPALTLPSAFVSAYVGENFACLLSANCEVGEGDGRVVSGVRIATEMQTPSRPGGAALGLEGAAGEGDEEEEGDGDGDGGGGNGNGRDLGPGESVQGIVRLDLKEEGNHILAVTVTYTESMVSGGGEGGTRTITGTRVRTFRKLYQFVAQQLLSVRTKMGSVPQGDGGSSSGAQYVLEAQLENMGEASVCLEKVELLPRTPFKSTGLNWDMPELRERQQGGNDGRVRAPVLNPRDVMQVAFLLQPDGGAAQGKDEDVELARLAAEEQRTVLGQMSIQWRGHMGDRGSLSTGWLSAKAR